MKAMNELFDDECRRSLKAYMEEPDPRLWKSVASQIETRKATPQRRWLLWIALALIVPTGIYFFTRGGASTHPSASESRLDGRTNPTNEERIRDNTSRDMPEKSTSIVPGTSQRQEESLSQLPTTERTAEPPSSNSNDVTATDEKVGELSADSLSILTARET